MAIDNYPPPLASAPARPRIAAMDVLRGIAVLGILLMNIQTFSMPESAYTNPTFYGDLTGWNYVVWLASHLLADMKFITIFSMLFGAGIILQSTSAGNLHPVRRHYSRMIVLLGMGAVHAYLLWYGDILVAYAVCGMILFWCKLPGAALLTIGVALLGVAPVIDCGLRYSHGPPFSWLRIWDSQVAPDFGNAEIELDAYTGGWTAQWWQRVRSTRYFETVVFATWTFWRCAGCMLIGMALLKLRVLTGAVRGGKWTLVVMAVLGIAMGMGLTLCGVSMNFRHDWDGNYLLFPGMQFNYWGSLASAIGYVAAVVLAVGIAQRMSLGRLLWPLEAVGRTALTNYIGQTAIATSLFYGHGLGWFGDVSRKGQLGIVVAIWALQLVASSIWLLFFKQGPLEWLWRVLAYRLPARMLGE